MKNQEIMDPWVVKFRDEAVPLIKERFHPKTILVFGSRVQNIKDEESDLDIIIVSDSFSEIPFINRYAMIFKEIKFPIHIDYICYTPEEFEMAKTSSIIIHDAISGPHVALV